MSRLYFFRSTLFLLFAYWVGYHYIDAAGDWVVYGNGLLTFNPKIYQIEIPFFLLLASHVYFPSVNSVILRNILPLIPVLVLYGLFDTFYNYFGRVATPSDFSNISEIFSFSIELALGLIFLYLLIPISVFLSVYFNQNNSFVELKKSLSIRVLSLLLLSVLLISPMATDFQKHFFNYTVWAQEDTIRENGRFSSSIFYAKQEYSYAKTLRQYSEKKQAKGSIKRTLFPGDLVSKRNVHIIVLESFIDPRLIKELALPATFIAKEILKYLAEDKQFSHVISPIYGGGTAESEFELLTGIKGLARVNQIEFNVMQGEKTNSFVSVLRSQGYYTQATIAPSSEFFNAKRAYTSLDFDRVLYLQDNNLLERSSTDAPIFDGELFDYNLNFIDNHLSTNNQPLFNYVLGMYGHLPFERNKTKRPDVATDLHQDDRLNRIANQFLYRTKAIAKYLDRLTKLDPHSIILIVSDHLPSILGENVNYEFGNKVNIALMLDGGIPVLIDHKNHYQLPWVIWDKLSYQAHDRKIDEEIMNELYFTLLAQSLAKND